MRLSLRRKKYRKLNLFIKTMVHRSNVHYSKINQKRNWKKYRQFPLEQQQQKKPPRQLIQLCVWRGGLAILEIDTQLNPMLKTKWLLNSKIIKPRQSILERFIMHWLKLILKSNQGWVLGHLDMKICRNKAMMTFFTLLLNPCLHFIKNRFTISVCIEEILKHPIILNSHSKLSFSSNNPYFHCIPLKQYYRQRQIHCN